MCAWIRRTVALLIAGGACGDGRTAPCDGVCVSDPEVHCVSEGNCSQDSNCPAGLRCAPAEVPGACRQADDEGVRCRPYGPHTFNPFILREGFAAPELRLTLDEAAQPTLTWKTPPGATFVSCAVFGCTPVFGDVGQSPIDETKTLRRIYNFKSCVLIHRVNAADEGSFVLANTGEEQQRGEDDPICDAEEVRERGPEHTELTAGCWAYDSTHVIRASNLVRLRPDQVAGIALPPSSCDVNDDGHECYLEGTSSFGICLDDTCRPRCLTSLDCEMAASGAGDAMADAGPCLWECVEAGRWRACRPTGP